MIRVLQVLGDLDHGGIQSMIMNLYRSMDKTQIQFDFIVHAEKHPVYYDEIIGLGGKIYKFPQFKGYNLSKIKKTWRKFFQEHPEYKILHSHVRSYASLYIPIAKKNGLKTIVHSHNTSNGRGVGACVKKIMQYPLRHQADYLFACSKLAGDWLFGKRAVKRDNFKILRNAIEVEKYRFRQETRDRYRKELGLEDSAVYIHVGRLHPSKNHSFLLDIFREIHWRNHNSNLVLVGDGDLRREIESKIKELNLADHVLVLGNRDDVSELLQASDCFLLPSKWEGLGIVAVEAQAASLKCICSENVPAEVNVSDLCEFIPLRNKNEWIRHAMDLEYDRDGYDRSQSVIKSGYDLKQTCHFLTDFYKGLV